MPVALSSRMELLMVIKGNIFPNKGTSIDVSEVPN
jgi:hypothetical protein